MSRHIPLFSLLCLLSCVEEKPQSSGPTAKEPTTPSVEETSLVLLGTIQDAGYPQIGCKKECCTAAFAKTGTPREVVSLGLIDKETDHTYLFEASPDIVRQMKRLVTYEPNSNKEMVDGIFLTHAHIGHYTGLMYLGKEATNADNVPVYAMPRMRSFLTDNGPWSQLVSQKNIRLQNIARGQTVALSPTLQVTPYLVPHRDEYSETVGYNIQGPNKSALFIPDIDKWDQWEKDIVAEVKKVDYAFLDATFYSGKELATRDISQIPHPFVIESMEAFDGLPRAEKQKIVFIHFNHTNPLIDTTSTEAQQVLEQGYRIGYPDTVFPM